ncbi:MAG: EAL domain-containing protein [Lachnospiraceae bacterium]|nr:EAL domain-containing protein [Lachnospiraceae bacterium]
MEQTSLTVQQFCQTIDMIYSCSDDYPYVYDFNNDFYYISPNAPKRLSMPRHCFRNVIDTFRSFVHPEDFEALQKDLEAVISGKKQSHNMQYRMLNTDSEPVWINCRGHVVSYDNETHYMVGCINEIGTRQKADNISGLLGESSLQSYLEEFSPFFPSGYLLRLGIDDFKGINERLGVKYGDHVLKKTAECISSCIQPGQQLYRLHADEFMVLDFLGDGLEHAINLYKNIRTAIDQFVEANQYEAVFTISGGILDSNSLEDFSFSDIMKLSEYSLNEAKRRGKNQCYLYVKQDYQTQLKRRQLKELLRHAVCNNFDGFEAYFQPLYSLETNTLYGAETLMRFHTKEFGTVSPNEFIPLLEETGLIIPLGRWILQQALFACNHIRQHIPNFQISVNVSSIQIMKSNIIHEILNSADEYGIPPSHIVIELTESGKLENSTHFTKVWSKLKSTGIRLALDDFGTGYSNFQYLNDLQPDIIKIDRSFTAKAMESTYEYNLLQLMSELVHNLDLKICIEGIETQEEKERMLTLNPDYSQGFYFGKPCPLLDFIEQFV